MSDFNEKIDVLYQLCRKVQERNLVTVNFSITNYEHGRFMSVSIYDEFFDGDQKGVMYDVSENGYQEQDNFEKAQEHLKKILMGGKMNKFSFAPETTNEEFAFLAGRVAALEVMLNADNSDFIDKKDVALILGISYIPKKD